MKVLVISPHPDDEVLGCGGAIARHADQGDEVHVLVATRGIPELFPPEQVERTRQEMQAAHKILGVTRVHFLDFPAPELDSVPIRKLAEKIGETIQEMQPPVVYLPYRGDLHVDHQMVYHATLVATRPINNCPVQQLLCYETLSETEWGSPASGDHFVPNVFIDIAKYLSRKLEALMCYQSQLKEFPHPRSLQAIEALAHLRGSTVSLKAAEAFMLVREIIA